ncbi:hypothetical protein ACFQMA_15960 [Halosimplex aquaticum]|uniref:DUF7968 domain-containing protein n=1 Tax=Halosimplex aquaticum TaxID=3026162 RepID=A0ABD5Y6E9_9EURY|nr:hypothetical protein [Halosimplex aquaticum]
MTASAPTDAVAERVVLRYAPATDRVTEELASPRYSAYLRNAEAGPVAPGDAWEHFVSRGCGATRDVTLTVEAVESGDRVGEATEFTFVPADGEDGESAPARDGGR